MGNPPAEAPSKGKVPVIVVILIVVLALCILIPCCLYGILLLLGPAVGNVFSGIISNLLTPTP